MIKQFSILGGDEFGKKKFHSSYNPTTIVDVDNKKIIASDGFIYEKYRKN